ncbi:MAG TPA: redoxin domain-containing protein [Verrucomicrobiae bacterium]|jgi:hypothetical protein|nr:redoxin domain-containing protein [Verrucomicrobiae bacterium]
MKNFWRVTFFQLWLGVFLSAGLLNCRSAETAGLGLDGKSLNPLANTNAATVLVFISDDCPISNRYGPELERLEKAYSSRGVKFWLVHSDATETASAIREHARAYELTIPEIRDPHQELAKLAHAQATPTAAVFTPVGKLVYHGRIDNRAVTLGTERAHATTHDLTDALDAVLAGRAVAVPATLAVGCAIPGL